MEACPCPKKDRLFSPRCGCVALFRLLRWEHLIPLGVRDYLLPEVGGRPMQYDINAEDINDRAKLMAHRLLARRLASDPGIIDRARNILAQQRAQGRCYSFLDEWDNLLDLGPESLRRIITQRSEKMARLRISSPLGIASGLFTHDEALRRRIRRKAKEGLLRSVERRAPSYAISVRM
jgi:hypothetical protein